MESDSSLWLVSKNPYKKIVNPLWLYFKHNPEWVKFCKINITPLWLYAYRPATEL